MQFHLSVLKVISLLLESISERVCLYLNLQIFFFCFCIAFSDLRVFAHFKLIFVLGKRYVSKFYFAHENQVFPSIFSGLTVFFSR